MGALPYLQDTHVKQVKFCQAYLADTYLVLRITFLHPLQYMRMRSLIVACCCSEKMAARKEVSEAQKDEFVEFIEANRNISGNVEFTNTFTNLDKLHLWEELTRKLNAIGPLQKKRDELDLLCVKILTAADEARVCTNLRETVHTYTELCNILSPIGFHVKLYDLNDNEENARNFVIGWDEIV